VAELRANVSHFQYRTQLDLPGRSEAQPCQIMIIGPRASLVCHEGTYHLWRRIPPGEKSIDRKLTSGVAGELARRSLV